jgi:RecA-family ATPase
MTARNGRTTDGRKRFRTRQESKELPAPDYLINGLMQVGCDAVLYAPSKSLKSFIALDIALSLATGVAVLEQFAIKGTTIVFYLAGEGRSNLEKKPATAWELAHGMEPYSVENIYIGEGVDMTSNDEVEYCIRDMEAILGNRRGKVPVMFIIDTLNRALNGKEEDSSGVAAQYLNRVKQIRERINGTSLTIIHTGKDNTNGIRGSSGYFAGFDTVLSVDNCNKDDDTGQHYLDLLVEKQKDDEDEQRYFFCSEKITTPDGESLVLRTMTEEDGRNLVKGRKPLGQEDVLCAIKELTAGDPKKHTTKRAIARLLSERLGMTIDGVEKMLDRKFKQYSVDGKWYMPSYLNGADESFADQLASFATESKLFQ